MNGILQPKVTNQFRAIFELLDENLSLEALSQQCVSVALPEIIDREIPVKDTYLLAIIESDVSNKADEAIELLHDKTSIVKVELLSGNHDILERYTAYCKLRSVQCNTLDYSEMNPVQKRLKFKVIRMKHHVLPLPVAPNA